jgi:hypothetical protein
MDPSRLHHAPVVAMSHYTFNAPASVLELDDAMAGRWKSVHVLVVSPDDPRLICYAIRSWWCFDDLGLACHAPPDVRCTCKRAGHDPGDEDRTTP